MKLLVVSHSCASAINQRLYAEIQRQTQWDVHLVVPKDWRDEFGNRLNETPESGISVIRVPVAMNGNIILHAYRFSWSRFLASQKFDAIYLNHEPYAISTAQICWANSRQKHPAVFGFYSCQNIYKKYPFPFSRLERFVYQNSKFCFPITKAVEDVVREKGFTGQSVVVPLALDSELYRPRTAEENNGILPKSEDTTLLGFVGRLVAAKGLSTFADALGGIKDLNWRLVVIGTGPDEESFRCSLRKNEVFDRTQFLGYVPHDETPKYLSAMDMLVVPSETQSNWKEQFGRVITEAMACGIPVIGSSSGEIPNLISASQGGAFFEEKNVGRLAEVLREWISSRELRTAAAANGRKWCEENMTIGASARIIVATIEGCMSGGTSAST